MLLSAAVAEPSFEFQAPTFTRAMKTLAAVFVGLWLVTVLLQGAGLAGFTGPLGLLEPLALVPAAVLQRGFVWQLVTHALLHDPGGVASLVLTVVGLWFLGSPLEQQWGLRRVLALLGVATLFGSLCVVAVGVLSPRIFGGVTVSPAAALAALLGAWATLHARQRVSLMGLATLTGGQLLGLVVVAAALQLAWHRDGAGVAGLAGFPVGYLFGAKGTPRGGTRTRRPSGPHLRVIRGGGSDLPN